MRAYSDSEEPVSQAEHDVITVGRVNMDLYAHQSNSGIVNATSLEPSVGGSPTNIAIASSRLGLEAIAVTAVGSDLVGDFVCRALEQEGVITKYVARKSGAQTSLALIGNSPPDSISLQFYRDDPADIHLTVEDVAQVPIRSSKTLLLSGNAFSRGSCVYASRFCAEAAHHDGVPVVLDLDLRTSEWASRAAYGLTMRSLLPLVDVLIGTEEEIAAALAAPGAAACDPEGDVLTAPEPPLEPLVSSGILTVVVKRGERGASVYTNEGRIDVPARPVAVVSPVGAGDAFAAGLIRSRIRGLDWPTATLYANACGAVVASKPGCSSGFPTAAEVASLLGE